MKKHLALFVLAIAIITGGLAANKAFAQPRNQAYTCVGDGVNCLIVDEEQHPSRDPQFLLRIDVGNNRQPNWVFAGSACPAISRTDVVSGTAVRGGKPEQWQGRMEGDKVIFVFQSTSPVELTTYYGRLDIGRTVTADDGPVKVQDATWRCISRRNPNFPLNGGVTNGDIGSTGGVFDTVRSWCSGCDARLTPLIESNGTTNPNGVVLAYNGKSYLFNIPSGIAWDDESGRRYGPAQVTLSSATFRLK